MARVEWNPVARELESMKERMESLYSKNFSGEDQKRSDETPSESDWTPAIDIWETEDEWVMVADLPGVKEEDLHLEMDGGVLALHGKRLGDAPPNAHELRRERVLGVFARSFTVPGGAGAEGILAEFRRGVLKVVVPKECVGPRGRRIALS